jgi:hypothetical protein
VEGEEWTDYPAGVWGHAGVFAGLPALVSSGLASERGEYHDEVEGQAGD